MISIVVRSNRNANWSFYQYTSDLCVIIRRNRVIISFENPGYIVSREKALKMLFREIHRYNEELYKSEAKNKKYNKYDTRRKTKYGSKND